MNIKILAIFLMILGAALLMLGFYQLNQYMSSGALGGQLASMSGLEALDNSTAYVQQLQQMYSSMLNGMIPPMFLDFLLGTILAIAGIAMYPAQK